MITVAVVALLLASARMVTAGPLAPRIANYTIAARYDDAAHTVTGHETLVWHNRTRKPAPDLYFHLYLNAFANSRSSFVHEAGAAWVDWLQLHPHGWGYITVQSLRIAGADLTDRVQFVHPDDDNIDDRTVFRLPLEAPVPPGGVVQVDIDFVARLPKVVARSGYAGPFALVAQWFPKIGVYENGAWNCHQYHLTTEFFADFGVYDVTLTVPRADVVGATGILRDQHDSADGTRTLHFVAEDVHDFAWAVDPRFSVVERTVGGTTVRLLLQPNHRSQMDRHLEAATAAIRYYAEWIGAYPYGQLTVVDPGPGGSRAGGMEYPMLITAGTAWWMPRSLRLPERVVVHEFGHQYWYGMVASNEFEEAWLDEGVNTYLEGRIMDAHYGAASWADLLGLRIDSTTEQRLAYETATQHDPMIRHAWEFLDRRSYTAISYGKTALVFDTLDGLYGGQPVRAALHAYFSRWRFRHPTGNDLLAAISAAVGQDLHWYFDQVAAGTDVLDYAVTRVDAEEAPGFAGYAFSGAQPGEEKLPEKPAARQYRSEVVVERLGGVQLPIDVQITFDDGTVSNEHWDGRDRWKRFEFTGPQRVEWAVVDPNDTMPLDVNRLNNSRMREAGTRGIVRIAGRWGFWFQNLVSILTGL